MSIKVIAQRRQRRNRRPENGGTNDNQNEIDQILLYLVYPQQFGQGLGPVFVVLRHEGMYA